MKSPSIGPALKRACTLSLAFLAWFFFVVMDLAAQYLQVIDPIDSVSLMLLRMVPSLVICYVWLYFFSTQDRADLPFGPKGCRKLIAVRSCVSFTGLLGLLYATRHITMSNVITSFQFRPFALALVSMQSLGESMNVQQYISASFSVLGEILIVKPTAMFCPADHVVHSGPDSIAHSSTFDHYLAVVVVFYCICGTVMDAIVMRKFSGNVSPALLLGMFSLVSVIGCSIVLLVWRHPIILPSSPIAWLCLGVVQVFGILTQVFRAFVHRFEDALTISLVGQANIVPTAIGEYLIFGSHFDLMSSFGAFITTCAGFWGILYSSARETPRLDPSPDETQRLIYERDDPTSYGTARSGQQQEAH